MSQPNQGKPASSAPTSPPWQGAAGSKPNGDVRFGAPGGKGTKGSK